MLPLPWLDRKIQSNWIATINLNRKLTRRMSNGRILISLMVVVTLLAPGFIIATTIQPVEQQQSQSTVYEIDKLISAVIRLVKEAGSAYREWQVHTGLTHDIRSTSGFAPTKHGPTSRIPAKDRGPNNSHGSWIYAPVSYSNVSYGNVYYFGFPPSLSYPRRAPEGITASAAIAGSNSMLVAATKRTNGPRPTSSVVESSASTQSDTSESPVEAVKVTTIKSVEAAHAAPPAPNLNYALKPRREREEETVNAGVDDRGEIYTALHVGLSILGLGLGLGAWICICRLRSRSPPAAQPAAAQAFPLNTYAFPSRARISSDSARTKFNFAGVGGSSQFQSVCGEKPGTPPPPYQTQWSSGFQ